MPAKKTNDEQDYTIRQCRICRIFFKTRKRHMYKCPEHSAKTYVRVRRPSGDEA